jgi:threonine dehydratase
VNENRAGFEPAARRGAHPYAPPDYPKSRRWIIGGIGPTGRVAATIDDMELTEILAARTVVRRHLPPTPQWSYPALNHLAGAQVLVKHENTQPIGAFKVRGGLVLLAGLPPAERARGVVTFSTGNHAQAIAYAAAVARCPCVVVMPEGANEVKVRAAKALDATVVLAGADLAGAAARAGELAAADGLRLISPGDESAMIAGAGTLYLELLTEAPDLDAVLVPIGSGTGAAAAGVVAAALNPRCEVLGVQSSASPAAHDSWRAGECVARPDRTAVGGLATGVGFARPQRLMRTGLADFLLVDDGQIAAAQRILATHAHTLAEGAGAAGLAAVLAYPDRFAGRRVAVICSGGNAGPGELAAIGG